MKRSMVSLVLAACLASASGSLLSISNEISPVSRVVELLNGLSTKIQEEMKTEEDMYQAYACWAKTTINDKKASNEKAKSRIDSLETYIADLDAGRIELTSERTDLENEVEGLRSDMEIAESLRKQEHEDYLAAKGELGSGIDALNEAIKLLKEATKDSMPTFLALGGEARAGSAESLSLAAELSRPHLSTGDAEFLQRLLSGDVPNYDWKKLNRKATYKMKYKARSGKIQDVLAALLQQFKDSLAEADKKEADAKKEHDTLMKSKGALLDTAKDGLDKLTAENGARGMSKDDADAEITDLKKQITDDEKHITDTETAFDKKKGEFSERKKIRVGEIEAISKAVAILHSDDARDTFARSLKSQGYTFMQLAQRKSMSKVASHMAGRNAAVEALATSKDRRIQAIAARILTEATGHFDKVITAIDKMITTLSDEETADTKNKGDCEKDRDKDTKDSIKMSHEVDEMSDKIEKLEGEIKELEVQIEEKKEEIKEIEEQMAKATEIRAHENEEWVKSDADDTEAIELVGKATDVLTTYYKSIAFVSVSRQNPYKVKAGEAPPPPPETWDAPYKGAQDENTGIVSILDLIKADIEKDQKDAKKAEDDAKTAFDKFIADSDKQIGTLNSDITTLEGDIAKKEGEISDTKTDRTAKKGELKAVVKRIKDAQPGCDFVTVNFEKRKELRKIEKEGLEKAKQILSDAAASR